MNLLALPPLLFGVGALTFATIRLHALAVRAPLAAAPFARAVESMLARGDSVRVTCLCEALRPAWGAELVGGALAEVRAGGDARAAIEEIRERLHWRVDCDAQVLFTLSRIAIPLSLALAIVELSVAFSGGSAGTIAVGAAHAALQGALRALATGVATAVFCRAARDSHARQARARFDELGVVSAALTSQMSRTTR